MSSPSSNSELFGGFCARLRFVRVRSWHLCWRMLFPPVGSDSATRELRPSAAASSLVLLKGVARSSSVAQIEALEVDASLTQLSIPASCALARPVGPCDK
eukprot:6178171-Pleurochrysis_carterae.AAC.1